MVSVTPLPCHMRWATYTPAFTREGLCGCVVHLTGAQPPCGSAPAGAKARRHRLAVPLARRLPLAREHPHDPPPAAGPRTRLGITLLRQRRILVVDAHMQAVAV